ncbi:hypothetical protein J4G37_51640, partial [Microvirga sp. 3-52]|nr:hypothetical protein [Microvirga sp. 3-52]
RHLLQFVPVRRRFADHAGRMRLKLQGQLRPRAVKSIVYLKKIAALPFSSSSMLLGDANLSIRYK